MKNFLVVICALLLMSSSVFACPLKGSCSPKNCPCCTKKIKDSNKPVDSLVGNFDREIKVFFSDIDGTLIPLDKSVPKGTIQPSVFDAKKDLDAAGIPLFVITGRSSGEAAQIAKKIGIKNQYVIGQQGAEILDPNGKLIHNDGISAKYAKKIISDVKKFNKKNYNEVTPFLYVQHKLYMFDKVDLPYIFDKPIIIEKVSDIGEDFTSIKIGLYSDKIEALSSIEKYLAKKYPEYNVVISADCYCDVTSKTATKGNAIKILSKKLGFKLADVAVIGDAENDISMLKLIKDNGGVSIAVDNANTKTKASAEYVSAKSSKDGFFKAVQAVLKNNKYLKQKCAK